MSVIGVDRPGLQAIICVSFDHRAPVEGLREFRRCLERCGHVDATLDVSGPYDLILETSFADLADYHTAIECLSSPIRLYVARYETNFVCKANSRSVALDEAVLWLREGDGYRRIDVMKIDRVCAERDYVRLHIGSANHLHHATIREMAEMLGSAFVRLHRSCIVRRDHVDRFIHEARGWKARLKDGTLQRVSRSFLADVLQMVGSRSSNGEVDSSKITELVDPPGLTVEGDMRPSA